MRVLTAISRDALRQLLNGSPASMDDPEFAVPPDYEPEAILKITQDMLDSQPSVCLPDAIRNTVIPLLLVLGLVSAIFWSPFIDQLLIGVTAGTLGCLMLFDLLEVGALYRAERLLKYTIMAQEIFSADSQYWRYLKFEENPERVRPEAIVWLLLFTGSLAIGWYLVSVLVLASAATHVYNVRVYLRRGEALVSYRGAWEARQKELEKQQAAAAAQQAALIQEVEEVEEVEEAESNETGKSLGQDL